MFHCHHRKSFQIDSGCCATVADGMAIRGVAGWQMEQCGKTAKSERSRDVRHLIARVARYLGDLAETRHSVR